MRSLLRIQITEYTNRALSCSFRRLQMEMHKLYMILFLFSGYKPEFLRNLECFPKLVGYLTHLQDYSVFLEITTRNSDLDISILSSCRQLPSEINATFRLNNVAR